MRTPLSSPKHLDAKARFVKESSSRKLLRRQKPAVKRVSLALILMTLAFPITLSLAPISGTPQAGSQSLVRVAVDGGGEFVFKDLSLSTDTLRGEVANNSDHDWEYANFSISLYDKSGQLLKATRGPVYSVFNIKKGETKSLGTKNDSRGWPIFIDEGATGVGLKFESGTYGVKYSFKLIKPVGSQDLTFEDREIRIEFTISQHEITFVLENKTDEPITINWNQASFMDITRTSQRVTHEGVKYADRNDSMPAATIPPTARVKDIILPTNLVSYDSRSSDWKTEKLFPDGPEAARYDGQKVSVFMPVSLKAGLKNYLFTFEISVR
jgi:hypothetical protein